uniref:Histone-lysine N-methyltransferase SETMAR n=1 Tax=Strongyloides venezuelensis TaxID=75913 RepID=A0A0K0G650_STRVS
ISSYQEKSPRLHNYLYCKETNYIEDQEYDVIELKTHLEDFYSCSSKTTINHFCQEYLRKRALGNLGVILRRQLLSK